MGLNARIYSALNCSESYVMIYWPKYDLNYKLGVIIAELARFYSTQSNNRYWATLSTCDTTDLRIDNIIVDRQIHRHRYTDTDTQTHRYTDTQTHRHILDFL